MAKIIDAEGKILTGDSFPQIPIGGKLYVVDNRRSTYKKIQAINQDLTSDNDPDEELVRIAMGDKAFKEIQELDLSVESFSNLTFLIISAITGRDFDEIKREAEAAARKN